MSISKRQEQILELLQEHRFLSVEKLSELTFTSASSIRRDLTHLKNLCMIKRTHGGAGVLDSHDLPASLATRMNQNVIGKRTIAKKAASLLRDGQTILLDSSSTAGFLIPHIAKLERITLFTNNMITAMNAINFGIPTHCIGGESVRQSAALAGEAAYQAVMKISPDILFFSSHSLDENGVISDPTIEENHIRFLMLQNARQRVFLCDHEKFGRRSLHTLTTLKEVDVCVLDQPWPALRTDCTVL